MRPRKGEIKTTGESKKYRNSERYCWTKLRGLDVAGDTVRLLGRFNKLYFKNNCFRPRRACRSSSLQAGNSPLPFQGTSSQGTLWVVASHRLLPRHQPSFPASSPVQTYTGLRLGLSLRWPFRCAAVLLSDCHSTFKEHDMSKAQKSNKESKKKPLLTFKEKREARHHKRDIKDALPPPIVPHR